MLLGSRNLAVGDTRQYKISYREFLPDGDFIDGLVITIPNITPGYLSHIGSGSLAPYASPDRREVIFWVVAGALNEQFTVQIVVSDSNLQAINDTIDYTIVSP
jgi:hypothetical protein